MKRLQLKYNALSNTGKKIILVLFCIIFCSCSVYVAIHSFNGNQPFTIQPIIISKPLPAVADHISISKSEYDRIERIKKDSSQYMSQGLLDSIRAFENIYQSQLKK